MLSSWLDRAKRKALENLNDAPVVDITTLESEQTAILDECVVAYLLATTTIAIVVQHRSPV